MKTALAILSLALIAGCAGLSDREQRVGSGAILGGIAGSVLSGGSTAATVGGAVLGGVVGDSVDRNARDKERDARDARERAYQDRLRDCERYNSRQYCAKYIGR